MGPFPKNFTKAGEMADFLVYYESFWKPSEVTCRSKPFTTWHSESETLYNGVNPGDSLWLVMHARETKTRWYLWKKFVVLEKRVLETAHQYGTFEIVNNVDKSPTFRLEAQKDFISVLKALAFRSGKAITATGTKIGNSLQSPRELTAEDVKRLNAYCKEMEKK
jgi:hypothetical protein